MLISYSKEEKITFCFWKYFFQACGIFPQESEINENWIDVDKTEPHLLILGTSDGECILPEVYSNRVYLVKRNAAFQKDSWREDVIKIDRWDKNKNVFRSVIRRLFGKFREGESIEKLLCMFMEKKIWGGLWLYDEMAFQEGNFGNEFILRKCKAAVANIPPKNDWHYRYMILYCDYVMLGISAETLIKRSYECERLLNECEEIAKIYDGWNAPLCILAGQICKLSSVTRKYALNYFRSSLRSCVSAEILYNIGYSYEKDYGDEEGAFDYYKRTYRYDKQYYRAMYKMAGYWEKQGNWMEAFTLYDKIRRILQETDWQAAITLKQIEYYYKSIRKSYDICRQNINGNSIMRDYKIELEAMLKKIREGEIFGKTFHCMFDRDSEKELKEKAINKLSEKFIIDCLQ